MRLKAKVNQIKYQISFYTILYKFSIHFFTFLLLPVPNPSQSIFVTFCPWNTKQLWLVAGFKLSTPLVPNQGIISKRTSGTTVSSEANTMVGTLSIYLRLSPNNVWGVGGATNSW